MMRHKLNKRHSRKMFTKHASKMHRRNIPVNPMRGGFRL